jgi:TRAP-type C4-dicarboxylate transport system permease small subunit
MDTAVRATRAISRALELLLLTAAGALMCVALASCALEAYDRYVQQLSWGGSFDQYARLALVGIVFFALPVATRHDDGIRLRLVERQLGPAARRRMHHAFDLVVIAVCGVFLSDAREVIQIGGFQGVMGTPLDYSVVYATMTVGFAATALFRVERLLLRLADRLPEPQRELALEAD